MCSLSTKFLSLSRAVASQERDVYSIYVSTIDICIDVPNPAVKYHTPTHLWEAKRLFVYQHLFSTPWYGYQYSNSHWYSSVLMRILNPIILPSLIRAFIGHRPAYSCPDKNFGDESIDQSPASTCILYCTFCGMTGVKISFFF